MLPYVLDLANHGCIDILSFRPPGDLGTVSIVPKFAVRAVCHELIVDVWMECHSPWTLARLRTRRIMVLIILFFNFSLFGLIINGECLKRNNTLNKISQKQLNKMIWNIKHCTLGCVHSGKKVLPVTSHCSQDINGEVLNDIWIGDCVTKPIGVHLTKNIFLI